MYKLQNFVNGKYDNNSNELIDIFDPSKGEVIGKVTNSNINDFNNTITSSRKLLSHGEL